jgi:hypothetical protein
MSADRRRQGGRGWARATALIPAIMVLLAACAVPASSPASGTLTAASPAAAATPAAATTAETAMPSPSGPAAQPAPTVAAEPVSTAAPGSAEPASTPTPAASSSPGLAASAPTPGPGGWITVPGKQGLLGLAGNGDVFVSVGRPGGAPEIRRLSPSGEILASTVRDERATKVAANLWLVDPTDDSVVGFHYDPGRVMRISPKSGRVIKTFRIPDRMKTPAIDGEGRIHLVCTLSTAGECKDVGGPGAVVVFDRSGKRLTSRRLYTERDCAFAAPAFMTRTTVGGIRALSTGFDRDGPCGGSGIRAVDLTASLRLGRGYPIPYERGYIVAWLSGLDIRDMAGAPGGRTYLVEVAKKNGRPVEYKVGDLTLWRHRLREIGPDGRVLRSWGHGGTDPGVDNPIAVELASDGTIWVLDSDPVARSAYTRYLPPSP